MSESYQWSIAGLFFILAAICSMLFGYVVAAIIALMGAVWCASRSYALLIVENTRASGPTQGAEWDANGKGGQSR